MLSLNVSTRPSTGKGPARRIRRLEQRVPGILYGGKGDPISLAVANSDLESMLATEEFFTTVVELNIDGTSTEKVIVKALQRHPTLPTPMHIDFLRIDEDTVVDMVLPIRYIEVEKCLGIREQGGMLIRQLNQVQLRAKANDMPAFLEVSVAHLLSGQSVHLSSINLPESVQSTQLVRGIDQVLATIVVRRGGAIQIDGEDTNGDDADNGESEES